MVVGGRTLLSTSTPWQALRRSGKLVVARVTPAAVPPGEARCE
jgi:hypothetical protein